MRIESPGSPESGADATVPFKAEGNVEGIFKADLRRDEVNGFLREFEELAGAKQALLFEVALGSFSGLGAKEVGETGGGEPAVTGDLSYGEGSGKMSADVIHRGANTAVEMSGLAMWIGTITTEDDFFQGVHAEFLAQPVGAGVELEEFAESFHDTGLLSVILEMQEEDAGSGFGPFQPLHPVWTGKEVCPEGFPVFTVGSGSVVVLGMRSDQNHIAGFGQDVALGVTEAGVAAQVINQHPIPAALCAEGVETLPLAIDASDKIARRGRRGFGAGGRHNSRIL